MPARGRIEVRSAADGGLARTLAGESLALAPDGSRFLAAAPPDGDRPQVRSLGTGELAWSLPHGDETAFDPMVVAVSPDGKTLAAPGGVTPYARWCRFQLWDAETGALLRLIPDELGRAQPSSVEFSPDGRLLALLRSGSDLEVWSLAPGRPRALDIGPYHPVEACAFSPDGQTLAVATLRLDRAAWIREVVVLDARTWSARRAIPAGNNPIAAVRFSPDGKTVAAAQGYDWDHPAAIRLWDPLTGAPRRGLSPPAGITRFTALAYTRGGRELVAAGGRTGVNDTGCRLVVWDAQTGGVTRSFPGPDQPVRSLAVSPAGVLAAGGPDAATPGEAGLWDLRTGRRLADMPASCVAFSPEGSRLYAAAGGAGIQVREPRAADLLATLQLLPAAAPGPTASEWIAFTPSGYYASSPGAGPAIRWRAADRLWPAEKYAARFRKPDRVRRALRRQ